MAITAAVVGDRAHDGTAYERFTPTGPVAVLPLRGGGYGTIWSCAPQRAAELLALDDAAYLAELQSRFGWRAGRFRRIGRRASYPLKLSRAATTVARRTVLIGNAAQALHPIAGQGFNLGLRDAALLAEVIADATGDVGSAELLRNVRRRSRGGPRRRRALHRRPGEALRQPDARCQPACAISGCWHSTSRPRPSVHWLESAWVSAAPRPVSPEVCRCNDRRDGQLRLE